MRADAQQNRERLLDATVDLILEVGGEPTRDSIADRAGVGIATLYRHFPDQQSLLHAVAHHVLDRSITAGEAALADANDGADAIRRYMHLAIDNGLGVLNIIYRHIEHPDWPDQRARAESLLHTMVDRARHDDLIRQDATVQDIVFAVLRACRPLATGIGPEDERRFAHRHIDIYLDGLTRRSDRNPLQPSRSE